MPEPPGNSELLATTKGGDAQDEQGDRDHETTIATAWERGRPAMLRRSEWNGAEPNRECGTTRSRMIHPRDTTSAEGGEGGPFGDPIPSAFGDRDWSGH